MVYVVKGDTMLLSETAVKDLGIFPRNLPQIGQFWGNIEADYGSFEITAKPLPVIYVPEESHQPLNVATLEATETGGDEVASSN